MMILYKTFFRKPVMLFVVMVGIFLPQSVVAQTVKGRVTDAITGETLIGAAVKVVELQGVGGVTNIDGEFSFTIAQSGRYTIETSYIGYEPSVLKEVLVAGAKDVILDITLRENSLELTEVVVKPRVNKETTINPTALVGGMMLSMEEASRYAGGYNDPARLVTAFAGVAGQGDGNGISVQVTPHSSCNTAWKVWKSLLQTILQTSMELVSVW